MAGMMATVGSRNPIVQRLQKLRAAREFFQAHIADLRRENCRYIVLHGEDVISKSDDSDDAWSRALATKVPLTECLLVSVPREGESFFF